MACVVTVGGVTDRASGGGGVTREPTEEERTFAGLNRGEIPSKSFQRLRSWTGTGASTFRLIKFYTRQFTVVSYLVLRHLSLYLSLRTRSHLVHKSF